MKPVTLKGVLDHDKEIKVLKWQNGEKGVEVITPFFTHLDKDEKPCAIMVNRGWMPWDLMDYKSDRNNSVTKVQGILYRGDAKTKYSKPNQVALTTFTSVYPEELATLSQLPNKESRIFMLKSIDFDMEIRTPMPDVVSAEELSKFGISPARHAAYENLWNGVTYCGILANTAFWLYL
jgi:cytochrome oxidase assembly protein ShyY1